MSREGAGLTSASLLRVGHGSTAHSIVHALSFAGCHRHPDFIHTQGSVLRDLASMSGVECQGCFVQSALLKVYTMTPQGLPCIPGLLLGHYVQRSSKEESPSLGITNPTE